MYMVIYDLPVRAFCVFVWSFTWRQGDSTTPMADGSVATLTNYPQREKKKKRLTDAVDYIRGRININFSYVIFT